MTAFYLSIVVTLIVSLSGCMYQVIRGPTRGDRMLVVQLFGTAAVAALVLLAEATGRPALIDVALVLALLAAITAIAFVRMAWSQQDLDAHRD